jgi:hypothetical protein
MLLARFVLVRRDGAQPLLSPIYDGPYRVLERSTHFFLLEMGDRTDKVSTLRLVRQVTFSLPPTAPPTTTSTSSASGRLLRAAQPPNRLNL